MNLALDRLELLDEQSLLVGQRGVNHRLERRPLRLSFGELALHPADARLHRGDLLLDVQGSRSRGARESETQEQSTETRDEHPRHAGYSSVRHERSVTIPSFESVSISASASS